jgi:hypothetical protein
MKGKLVEKKRNQAEPRHSEPEKKEESVGRELQSKMLTLHKKNV